MAQMKLCVHNRLCTLVVQIQGSIPVLSSILGPHTLKYKGFEDICDAGK